MKIVAMSRKEIRKFRREEKQIRRSYLKRFGYDPNSFFRTGRFTQVLMEIYRPKKKFLKVKRIQRV